MNVFTSMGAWGDAHPFISGAIIGGVISNLLAHWLISKFPAKYRGLMSTVSTKWRVRSEKLKEEREKRIAPLVGNFTEQQILLSLATAKRAKGIFGGFITLFMAVITLLEINGLLDSVDHYTSLWKIVTVSMNLLFFSGITTICFFFFNNDLSTAETMVDDVIQARKRQTLRVE